MGQMRFVVPRREQMIEGAIECAYLAGIEGIPWRGRCRWVGGGAEPTGRGEFVVERALDESGNLFIPWYVAGHGELVLSTASLMERATPYSLPVELARGTLSRLRNQLSEWQMSGLNVPTELQHAVKVGAGTFLQAVVSDSHEQAAYLAEQTIKAALDAGELLVDEYCRQMLDARRGQAEPLPTLLGGILPARQPSDAEASLLSRAWNSALVPVPWRDIENSPGQSRWDVSDQQIQWCSAQGWRTVVGPLLSLARGNLPDWIYLWEEDFDQLQAYVRQFVQAVVARYRGKIQVWHCAAGINVDGALSLSEEQRLRLVVAAIDDVRRADPHTPILVSFDRPWAEYLATTALELSPLHFADSLIRADLGIAGLGLEFNVGYWPGGTLPRDRIEFSRQLDRWSLLGLPLAIFLTMPSSAERSSPERISAMTPRAGRDGPSPETQRLRAEQLLPLGLAKHYVQGLFWGQLCDADPGGLAHGGLFDATHRPKPVLDVLASIRQRYLQ